MKVQTLTKIRQYHNYVGLFFAPAIIFFAISGALQTFRLQEEKGYGGPPPIWIVVIAELHKDQMLPKAKPNDADATKPAGEALPVPKIEKKPVAKAVSWSRRLLQIFSVLMAAGLVISSALGITIALSNRAARKKSCWILAGGVILPLLPLIF